MTTTRQRSRAARTNLEEMSTDYLECRSWAHAWKHVVTYVTKTGRTKAYELHLRCLRCPAERRDLIVRGDVMSRRYTYPRGYLVKDLKAYGGRSVFNATVRTALVSRLAVPMPQEEE